VRIALDSSVLVAAHITRAGVCAELLEEVLLGHELVLSVFISAPFRNPRKTAGLKSKVMPDPRFRFPPGGAPAFLPSS
jgi:hypothetical protein